MGYYNHVAVKVVFEDRQGRNALLDRYKEEFGDEAANELARHIVLKNQSITYVNTVTRWNEGEGEEPTTSVMRLRHLADDLNESEILASSGFYARSGDDLGDNEVFYWNRFKDCGIPWSWEIGEMTVNISIDHSY